MYLRKLLFALNLLVPCFSLLAQDVEFEHITDRDGLINNSVTAIIKDADGFMWFGTFNGLSRYDGYSFTHFVHDPGNPKTIEENYIRCLYESKDKKLYIGFNFHGFSIYDKETETFQNFNHDEHNVNSLINDYVMTIFADHTGTIWIGTRYGLDKFDPATKTFTHFLPFQNIKEKNFIASISEDLEGNLWLYGHGNEICKFNPVNISFEYHRFSETANLSTVFVRGGVVKADSHGNIWIGNELDGLRKYNERTGQTELFSVLNGKIKSNIISCIAEDSEGNIWFGTDGVGLCRYIYASSELQQFTYDAYDPKSLKGNAVYTIYESEPGILWFGTYSSGLNIWKKNKNKFATFNDVGKSGKRLLHKSVLDIIQAKDGNIWMGTDGGGLNQFDPVTSTFKYFTEQNSKVHASVIKSLTLDHDNNLWCGTFTKGLTKLNLEKNTSTLFGMNNGHTPNKNLTGDNVWSLCSGSNGDIYIGLLSGGLNIYHSKTGIFQHESLDTTEQKVFSASNVQVIVEDSKKRIWIGTETNGAFCYDPTENKYIQWFQDKHKSNLLHSNDIRDIFEDSDGNMWFATKKGGLSKLLNFEKNSFITYTIREGLPSNNVRCILEDAHKNLWLSTDKGISCFHVREKKFFNFDIEDGLQGNEYNTASGLKTKNGYMYFGGIDGFNVFHPDSIKFNKTPPPVVITDFKIFNQSLRPHVVFNDKVYLKNSIIKTNHIELDYHDYVFSIEFAALNFIAPQKNKYAYKLEGFNDKWTYVDADKRFATYTNLDPGEYTFRVIACNNDDVWNYNGTALKITIPPPWWMTWWFRFIIVAGFITAIAGFFYMKERSIRIQNKMLENEVRKRTAELLERNSEISKKTERILKQQEEIVLQRNELESSNKTKDKFFSIIAHDLRNPVNAMSFLIKQLKLESAKYTDSGYQELMHHVENSSDKIQKLVFNLLEWARTQSGNIRVKKANFKIRKVIEDNQELIHEQAKVKNITLISHVPEELGTFADYNMVSTIIRNLLSNSIKFTSKDGIIEVSGTILSSNQVRISIKDNGVGMREETRNKLFKIDQSFSTKGTNNESGTGLGLLICQEFAALNDGKLSVESELGVGTVFYIDLPGES